MSPIKVNPCDCPKPGPHIPPTALVGAVACHAAKQKQSFEAASDFCRCACHTADGQTRNAIRPVLVLAKGTADGNAVRRLTQEINGVIMARGFEPTPELASALLNLALLHCLAQKVDKDAIVDGVRTWLESGLASGRGLDH